jgi:hypothetical protein
MTFPPVKQFLASTHLQPLPHNGTHSEIFNSSVVLYDGLHISSLRCETSSAFLFGPEMQYRTVSLSIVPDTLPSYGTTNLPR